MLHDHRAEIFAGLRPLSSLSHPREMIRQFTPNWFAATMGTGILALMLAQFPFAVPGLRGIGQGLWLLDIVLFIVFSGLYAARWIMFGSEARRIFGHSIVSMFIGTIPMGLATIINGLLAFGLPLWGPGVVPVAEALWWLDIALAVVIGVGIPYLMFTRQDHSVDQMTAVWLLPVVVAEVAAVTGGLLAPHLAAADRFPTLVASYVLWGYSVPLAFGILAILILRMALYKLPPSSMASSSWLALGPIGTGALGMVVLGQAAPAIFGAAGFAEAGHVAAAGGLIVATILWGFGLWWLLLGTLITARYARSGVPFNLGWWGYIFPLGVYALATIRLGATLHLGGLSIFGALLTVVVGLLWVLVAARTIDGGWKGHLFVSPCIAKVD
ncbi:TDT family transporter [Polymorphobacter sp. PAMC 29334]|uniref:TDT family transporter n=1 Tax=Polymorphobacter sp. PAMC 29334 TaxID=2862331 RepID=UPI001C7852D4|nr:TDT family transporter [Polymorphobacter sp. PAMC 29334]QYE34450.1 TDT family transporter [Polymorphobacter sp. PAMC 29334]